MSFVQHQVFADSHQFALDSYDFVLVLPPLSLCSWSLSVFLSFLFLFFIFSIFFLCFAWKSHHFLFSIGLQSFSFIFSISFNVFLSFFSGFRFELCVYVCMQVKSGANSLQLLYYSVFLSPFLFLQDETRKKAASTYLVENSDIPPPRYQKDGTLPMNYPNNTANSGMSINFWFFVYSLHAWCIK